MHATMKRSFVVVLTILGGQSLASAAEFVELPGHYFKLMDAEVKAADATRLNNGAMFAAAVLYTKKHPANPSFGDKKKLELALKLGDLQAAEAMVSKKDTQDYEWEIHFWLDTFRLLDKELGAERRARWAKGIETITQWFAREVKGRGEYPRLQWPYIVTSPNHFALWASTVYLAGKVLPNKEWEDLGARVMHRFAVEECSPDGYFGEFTDNGPATGYNFITMNCVALYLEHSQDKDAYDAMRRATTFHKNFTWPNGVPVETIDGRNRYREISAWGHFGFTHWPDGRRFAQFMGAFFPGQERGAKGKGGSRSLGRIAQSALYYHEGPTEPTPQEMPRSSHRMKVPAGIRKTGPWVVCLSGLTDVPVDIKFTLDRQGHISVFHEKLGLIIAGANSREQPELATFLEKTKERARTMPLHTTLRMDDSRDRLGLAYQNFWAEAEVPPPTPERMTVRFVITETGRNRTQDVTLNLQLVLKEGETLETAKTKTVLGTKRIELGPEEIGGWIKHRGWTMRVDPTARLVWPIYPFNPYKNAPETNLKNAVGRLTVPVKVQTPPAGEFNWRRGEIAFALEAKRD